MEMCAALCCVTLSGRLTDGFSIREFCELQTPIFMFDKDGAFVVMKLEQVSVCCLVLWLNTYSFICKAASSILRP